MLSSKCQFLQIPFASVSAALRDGLLLLIWNCPPVRTSWAVQRLDSGLLTHGSRSLAHPLPTTCFTLPAAPSITLCGFSWGSEGC